MVAPEGNTARSVADIAALVDTSPSGISVCQDERIVYVNAACVRMFGMASPAEMVGRPMADIHPSESLVAIQERCSRLPASGYSPPAEYDLRRPDGSSLRVEAVSARTRWAGRPAMRTTLREVTSGGGVPAAVHYRAALVQHVSDAIIGTTRDGVVTGWNPAAERIYGLSQHEALGWRVAHVVGADLDPASLISAGGVTDAVHRRADGSMLAVRVSVAEMTSGFVLICADETARRRAEDSQATVLDALSEGVIVVGPSGTIESANPAASHILGAAREDIVGTALQLWPVFDEAGARMPVGSHPMALTQCTGLPCNDVVLSTRRADGTEVWVTVAARSLTPGNPGPHRVVATLTDITEARAIHQRLQREATRDPLTGLANRTRLLGELDAALAGGQQSASVTGVLFIDLDNFKVINDSLGHSTGDTVLRLVAQRLRRHVRRRDLVGRIGGDEFVVIATRACDSPEEIQSLAERLRRCLSEPIQINDRRLHVNACIGIALASPGDSRSAPDILRDADVAMYQAKGQGRGRFAFFDVHLRERMQRSLLLQQDLCEAIRRDQLWIAYQPILDLDTGQTVAVEGLLRWTHPVHGPVSPEEFIPLAEHNDLIHDIGAHILRTAFADVALYNTWQPHPVQLRVNLSARQLEDPNLPHTVRAALSTTALSPSVVGLEVTESTLMRDPIAATQLLSDLRQHGITLAIDDFGTGYSCLAQLQQLPLDTLKIDRCFIARISETSDAKAIVASIIAMAHTIGLTVIAEGVETAEQLAAVRRLGCDQAQGFHLAHPVPITQLHRATISAKQNATASARQNPVQPNKGR